MDMDDVGKKEPHEHSRTTTYLRESTIFLSAPENMYSIILKMYF